MVHGPEQSCESIVEMDAELSRLARGAGALRLELAVGFEALAQRGGHHEMGFSSLEAYALERCERSTRWVQEARALARRLNSLPQTCRALRAGRVTWSMAGVIAKAATSQDEEWWLAEAGRRTVRQMRQLARARRELDDGRAEAVLPKGDTGSEKFCTLALTVDREDAWLFECARMIVGRLGGRTMEDVVYALTAEGCTTLQPTTPADFTANWNEEGADAAQRAWEAELQRWREEAEQRCEASIVDRGGSECGGEGEAEELEWDGDIRAIDAQIRRLAAELTTREAAIGKLAERFWHADGWRRLGFATESQYARERLGVSLSAVAAKRRLARALRRLQPLEQAIGEGQIGYEAARLVIGVANCETVGVWIERAAERTVKHLREEVDAVQMLERLSGKTGAAPPSLEVMAEVERAQSRITSGQMFQKALAPGTQMSAPTTVAASPLAVPVDEGCDRARARAEAVQMSALSGLSDRLLGHAQMFSRCRRSQGSTTLRLRVTAETARFYRWLERRFYRYSTVRMPFLRFLCRTLIETWKHALGSKVAYADIYARDGYRCKSPVCSKTDVTPHHLRFRSAGGDDREENLATLCVWCHLEGVHAGRVTAVPPASGIQWRIGREAHTIIDGRHRVRLNSPWTTSKSAHSTKSRTLPQSRR